MNNKPTKALLPRRFGTMNDGDGMLRVGLGGPDYDWAGTETNRAPRPTGDMDRGLHTE